MKVVLNPLHSEELQFATNKASEIIDLTATLDLRYLVKAGISGGQTAIGGTAITDILKLQGTSGNGTLTSPAIQALVGNNGATTALTILNNGNVGIGTTGPSSLLHLSGAGSSTIKIFDTDDNRPGLFEVDSPMEKYPPVIPSSI